MSKNHKTPTVFQMEAAECGAASLAMILAYYGKHIPLEQLRIDAGVSRDGSKAGNLIRAAKKYDLEGHGYKKDCDALKTVTMPCILVLRRGHFVVLEGFRGQYAFLNDPAVGRRKIKTDELQELYSGVVLTFRPTPAFKKEKSKDRTGIGRRISGYYKGIAASVIFGVSASAFGLGGIFFFQQLYDNSFSGYGLQPSFGSIASVVICMLAACLMWWIQSFVTGGFRSGYSLRSQKVFVEKLFRLPVAFYEQRYIGESVNRARRNAAVDKYVTDSVTIGIISVVNILLTAGLLLTYQPLLLLLSFVCASFQTAFSLIAEFWGDNAHVKKASAYESVLAGKIYTGLREIETLKATGAEHLYLRSLGTAQNKLSKQRKKHAAVRLTMSVCRIGLLLLALCILTVICVSMVNAHILTQGKAVASLLLYIILSLSADKLVVFICKSQSLKPDTVAANDVLSYPDDKIYNKDNKSKISKAEGHVKLENVSFAYYPLSPPVIKNLSMDIRPGSNIAIVGPSGSGKSTIAVLISGVYRPQKGRVTLDGVDLLSVSKRVINASVSVVSQQPALFSGTIKDNITMWNSKIPEKDVIAAARDACILDCILKREGQFEAPVAENGVNFSGGQRRRLELARALATNPSVLLMDEATAALDAVTEQKIMENIKRRGCTCVVIAHRLSAVQNCDIVAVVENGTVVQQGTHDELIAEEGVYRSLHKGENSEVTI